MPRTKRVWRSPCDGKASDLERQRLKQNIDRIWMCNTQDLVYLCFLFSCLFFEAPRRRHFTWSLCNTVSIPKFLRQSGAKSCTKGVQKCEVVWLKRLCTSGLHLTTWCFFTCTCHPNFTFEEFCSQGHEGCVCYAPLTIYNIYNYIHIKYLYIIYDINIIYRFLSCPYLVPDLS